MTFKPEPDDKHPDTTDSQHGDPRPARHHHHRHGHRHERAEPFTDEPVGTTPEALAEAFFGVGRLLRGRGSYRSAGPRRDRLTFARGALLAALDTDGPQRMGHLAHRLGVVPRTITPMVDALEDGGLVTREDDPDDRRATMLRITDAGRTELTRSRSDRKSTIDEVFEVLSDGERTVLAAVLDKLRAAARTGLERDRDPRSTRLATQGDNSYGDETDDDPERPSARRGRGRGPRGRRERRREGWHPRFSSRREIG
jgi:DNA-binding MarR family transcriptional regulator